MGARDRGETGVRPDRVCYAPRTRASTERLVGPGGARSWRTDQTFFLV